MFAFASPYGVMPQRDCFRLEALMGGSCRSLLVRDSAEALWVMKDAACPKEMYRLVNETLGWEFCHMLGIPFPDYRLVQVHHSCFDKPGAWFQMNQRRRPKSGLHFCSRFIPDRDSAKAYEQLPGVFLNQVSNRDECLGMFVFDVWADHQDRRQAIFTQTESGLKATFIDNTHLFGGPDRNCVYGPSRLSAVELVALAAATNQEDLQHWIARTRRIMPQALDRTLSFLPCEWWRIQLRDAAFRDRCEDRLERLEELVHYRIAQSSNLAPSFRSHYFCLQSEDDYPTYIPLV